MRALALALLLGACAASQPMGPAITRPALTDSQFTAADGHRLPVRHTAAIGPETAIFAALHGFNDYASFVTEAAEYWAEKGIETYAVDQRGFGLSDRPGVWAGTATMEADAAAFARAVCARRPDVPCYLLGHSMGGAVAVLALTGADPPPVTGAILLAPALWSRGEMGPFLRAGLFLTSTLLPNLLLTGNDLGIQASDNIPYLVSLGRDPLFIKKTRVDALDGVTGLMSQALARAPGLRTPLLVLYGRHEEVLPPEAVQGFLAALPADGPRRVLIYPEGWHMLLSDLQRRQVWDDIAAWVADPAAPLAHEAPKEGLAAGGFID